MELSPDDIKYLGRFSKEELDSIVNVILRTNDIECSVEVTGDFAASFTIVENHNFAKQPSHEAGMVLRSLYIHTIFSILARRMYERADAAWPEFKMLDENERIKVTQCSVMFGREKYDNCYENPLFLETFHTPEVISDFGLWRNMVRDASVNVSRLTQSDCITNCAQQKTLPGINLPDISMALQQIYPMEAAPAAAEPEAESDVEE